MGEQIKLVPTMGCFITMNPDYAGRTQLPENLKALFRSCAMVIPDMDLICENMLMSEGFLSAQRLSKKFTQLYQLASQLLSKQIHYDWVCLLLAFLAFKQASFILIFLLLLSGSPCLQGCADRCWLSQACRPFIQRRQGPHASSARF